MLQRIACSIEGCDRQSRARGWCKLHYRRWETFGDVNAIPKHYQPRHSCGVRDDLGRKYCQTCDTWRPVEHFYTNRQTSDGLSHQCKTCGRLNDILRKYKIDVVTLRGMLAAQDDACLLCHIPFDETKRLPSIDHDHTCCPGEKTCGKCVRGILCSNCNTGLGLFKDNPELLRAAAAYLSASLS